VAPVTDGHGSGGQFNVRRFGHEENQCTTVGRFLATKQFVHSMPVQPMHERGVPVFLSPRPGHADNHKPLHAGSASSTTTEHDAHTKKPAEKVTAALCQMKNNSTGLAVAKQRQPMPRPVDGDVSDPRAARLVASAASQTLSSGLVPTDGQYPQPVDRSRLAFAGRAVSTSRPPLAECKDVWFLPGPAAFFRVRHPKRHCRCRPVHRPLLKAAPAAALASLLLIPSARVSDSIHRFSVFKQALPPVCN
jgi:hypothetical protein